MAAHADPNDWKAMYLALRVEQSNLYTQTTDLLIANDLLTTETGGMWGRTRPAV